MNAVQDRHVLKRTVLLLPLLLLAAFLPRAGGAGPAAQPPSYSYLGDTYDFRAGVFSPQLDTKILVNFDPVLPGSVIDLESTFGLPDRQSRPWLEFNWRPAMRSTLRFIYFDTERSGAMTIDRDIRFGERTFTAPSEVSAFHSSRYYWLSYQYLFLRNVFNEFGISPGVVVADVKSVLSARPGTGAAGSKEVSFVAAIPVIGLYLSSQVMSRVFLRNTVRVMDINAGDYATNLFNYTISLDYNPFRNWGVGAGYFFSRVEITRGFISYDGSFLADSSGGVLYLKYFFL